MSVYINYLFMVNDYFIILKTKLSCILNSFRFQKLLKKAIWEKDLYEQRLTDLVQEVWECSLKFYSTRDFSAGN